MTTFVQQPRPTAAASATRLLDLFAPTGDHHPKASGNRRDNLALWRIDAIHRAKNMAQLSMSLAHIVSDRPDRWGVSEAATPARALARTYEVLGLDNDSVTQVPCFDMISNVATGLGTIFGQSRNIDVQVAGSEVFATPENRRALTLICSELVINALKYAFPVTGIPGLIAVEIGAYANEIVLVVTDSGIGLQSGAMPGLGSGLLSHLCRVSGANLQRSTGDDGIGLQVTVKMPVAEPTVESNGMRFRVNADRPPGAVVASIPQY